MTAEPAERFYESQGLRLHYVDWGNETAPPLILVHGGLDHCRNWDAIARELQPHFHIMAPDLRGHGDSEWAKGSSYSLVDHVYDLSRLIRFTELRDPAIVGHSLGGMISLAYAGTYPDRVSRLAVLDGAFLSGSRRTPIHEQMSRWIDQLDRISRARTQRVPDHRGGGDAVVGAQQAADTGAGAASGPARRSAGRRRPLSLEVRSLSADEGAVPAVIG